MLASQKPGKLTSETDHPMFFPELETLYWCEMLPTDPGSCLLAQTERRACNPQMESGPDQFLLDSHTGWTRSQSHLPRLVDFSAYSA